MNIFLFKGRRRSVYAILGFFFKFLSVVSIIGTAIDYRLRTSVSRFSSLLGTGLQSRTVPHSVLFFFLFFLLFFFLFRCLLEFIAEPR